MLDYKKTYFIFKESLEDSAEKLLSFLNKSSIKKVVFLMTGSNKKQITIRQALRVRYAYCAYRLIAEEFGNDFASRWFSRPNICLEQRTPIFALRHYDPEKLPHIIKAAMACIQASHGILP